MRHWKYVLLVSFWIEIESPTRHIKISSDKCNIECYNLTQPRQWQWCAVSCDDVNTRVYIWGGGGGGGGGRAGPGGRWPGGLSPGCRSIASSVRTSQLGARPGWREAQQQLQISVSVFCIFQSFSPSCIYSIFWQFIHNNLIRTF